MAENPFSTNSGFAKFGISSGAPVWGATVTQSAAVGSGPAMATAAAQPEFVLTVRVPKQLGSGLSTVDLSMRDDATVGDLLLELRARLALPAELVGQLKLFCAGRAITSDLSQRLKDVAGEKVLHLIAPGGAAAMSPSLAVPSTSVGPVHASVVDATGRSAAANAAAAAAASRAAACSGPSIAPAGGVIKVRFAAREVVIDFDGRMTAAKFKGEIAARDGTALAAGLRLFFCGRELVDALPLSMQAGRLGPGAVVTAQMVIPACTSSRASAAHASPATDAGAARPSRFVGLRNQGATCYLNSLVQCLYMTPELRGGLQAVGAERPPARVSCALSSLFSALSSASTAVSTEALTRALASALVGGSSSRQEDVHEFWQVLTDRVERELRSTAQAELLPTLFNGTQCFYVRCGRCGYVSHTDDTFQDLKLAVAPEPDAHSWRGTAGRTLHDGASTPEASPAAPDAAGFEVGAALEDLLRPEQLRGPDQYFCERCACKVDAERGLALRRLPRVLALQLKRFRYDFRLGQRLKINDHFRFPTSMDMADYVRPLPGADGGSDGASLLGSPDAMDVDSAAELPSCDRTGACARGKAEPGADLGRQGEACAGRPPMPYELYAVLVHSGSASFGHYFALIKDLDERGDGRGEWHEFNDQLVRPIKESDLAKAYGGSGPRGGTSSAYMLLYRAVDMDVDSAAGNQGLGVIASPSQARGEVPRPGVPTGGSLRVGHPDPLADASSHEPKRICLAPAVKESTVLERPVAVPEPEADASENPYNYMGF